ncbi:hypothetical protein NN561_016305 [Cricetulus griseus]
MSGHFRPERLGDLRLSASGAGGRWKQPPLPQGAGGTRETDRSSRDTETPALQRGPERPRRASVAPWSESERPAGGVELPRPESGRRRARAARGRSGAGRQGGLWLG